MLSSGAEGAAQQTTDAPQEYQIDSWFGAGDLDRARVETDEHDANKGLQRSRTMLLVQEHFMSCVKDGDNPAASEVAVAADGDVLEQQCAPCDTPATCQDNEQHKVYDHSLPAAHQAAGHKAAIGAGLQGGCDVCCRPCITEAAETAATVQAQEKSNQNAAVAAAATAAEQPEQPTAHAGATATVEVVYSGSSTADKESCSKGRRSDTSDASSSWGDQQGGIDAPALANVPGIELLEGSAANTSQQQQQASVGSGGYWDLLQFKKADTCSSDSPAGQQRLFAAHYSNSTCSIKECGGSQPESSNSSSSNTTSSGSGSQGSSGGGGEANRGAGASGTARMGSSSSSAGGAGAGGSSGQDGDDDSNRRGSDRQQQPLSPPAGAATQDPDPVKTENTSELDGPDPPPAQAAEGVVGTPAGVGCSASDPVVMPGPAALGMSPAEFRLLGSPASLISGSADGGRARSASQSGHSPAAAAAVSQQGMHRFALPATLPQLNLSAVDTADAGGMSSLADALLSPLAAAGLGLAASTAAGLGQQGVHQQGGMFAAGMQGISQHIGSLDGGSGTGFPGFSGLGSYNTSPLAAGWRASDTGPSAAAAAAWNFNQLLQQQQQQASMRQQALQQQLIAQQQQQQQLGLALGSGLMGNWSGATPSSILALEQQLQQINLGQQRQTTPLLSPAGSGSIHPLSPMLSGQLLANPHTTLSQHGTPPLLSPTPSLGMPPLPPQQHSQRPPLLPSSCSAPAVGRHQVSERRAALSSQLHLFNPGLMGLIGSNDPGLGYSSSQLSMSSSDNLLTWLSNDEFGRAGTGVLSGSASETDAAALARAAAALSGTAMPAGQSATAVQSTAAEQQGLQQRLGLGGLSVSSSSVLDAKQYRARDQNAAAAAIKQTSSICVMPETTPAKDAPGSAAPAAAAAAPAAGLALASSSSMSRVGSIGSSGSGAASSIAHSVSGESLSDLDEMKARSASFAAALAEAEAIAAGVEAAFEAARQQAGAPAEEGSGSAAPGASSAPASSSNSPTEAAHAAAYDPAELTKGQASRHLWLGNLHQRLPRSILRGVFERFGPVDDVVTFPGRMYAFVNFKEAVDAARAAEAVQDKEIPVITGNRRLVVKFRLSRRALGKVAEAMVPGLVDPATASASSGSSIASSNAGSTVNLAAAAAATAGGAPPGLIASRSSSGSSLAWLAAAANAGASGGEAGSAAAASNVAASSGQGVTQEPSGLEAARPAAATVGGAVGTGHANDNVLSSTSSLGTQLDQLLPPLAADDSDTAPQRDQTTPAQQQNICDAAAAAAAVAAAAAAVANSSTDSNAATAAHVAAAAAALAAVDPGAPHGPGGAGGDAAGGDDADIPEGKPSRHLWLGNIPLKPNRAAMESLFSRFGPLESVRVFPGKTFAFVNFVHAAHAIAAKSSLDGQPSPHITGPKPLVIRFQKDTAGLPAAQAASRAPEAAAARARKPIGRTSLTGGSLLPGGGVMCVDEDFVAEPAVNLSNKLNPNNIHYDRELAARYKRMSKSEKEALWAQDRAMQQLEQNPAAASLLSAAAVAAAAAAGQGTGGLFDPMLQQQSQAAAAATSLYGQLMSTNPQLAAAAALQQAQSGAAAGMFPRSTAWNQAAAYQQAAAAAALQAQATGAAGMNPAAGRGYGGLQQYMTSGFGAGYSQQYAGSAGSMNNQLLSQMASYLSSHQDPTAAAAAAAALQLQADHDPAALAALGLDPAVLQAHLAGMEGAAAGSAVPASPAGHAAAAALGIAGGSGAGFTSLSGPQSHSAAAAAATAGGMPGRRMSYPGAPQQQQQQQQQSLSRLSGGWGQHTYASDMGASGMSGSHRQSLGEYSSAGPGAYRSSTTGSGLLGPASTKAGTGALGPIGPTSASTSTGGADAAAPGSSTWGGLGPTGSSSTAPPQWRQQYLCPLTQQLMSDPVLAADGYTYERSAITEWFRVRVTSPVTGMPLGSAVLQPNYALRQVIAAEVAQMQGAAGGY